MFIHKMEMALERRRLERLLEECRRVMFDIETPNHTSMKSGFSLDENGVWRQHLVAVIHHFVPTLIPITGIFGDDTPHAWLEVSGSAFDWVIDPYPLLIHPGPVLVGIGSKSPFRDVYRYPRDMRNEKNDLTAAVYEKIDEIIRFVESSRRLK